MSRETEKTSLRHVWKKAESMSAIACSRCARGPGLPRWGTSLIVSPVAHRGRGLGGSGYSHAVMAMGGS